MELSKKTTILLPPAQHEHLTRLAKQRGLSMGALIRRACEKLYGSHSSEARLAAVDALASLSLPVGEPDELKRESTSYSQDSPT